MEPTTTAHKARAAGMGGAVAGAVANLIGFYIGMPIEQQLSLSVVLGFGVPFLWAYYQRNYPR